VNAWRELVSTALLGTERRDPAATAPLEIVRQTPEEQLLARAAATVVYRRAGIRPRRDLSPLQPSAPETLPRCSAAAALRLGAILGGEFMGVLDEWLQLAAARGVRAPEELLPALLAAGRGRRESVLAVAGERGCWLGRLDEAWDLGVDDEVWRTGTLDVRRAWLRHVRAGAPERARQALAETWGEEDPRARAALLGELATGLSLDDEPFLETALDDRRQEVRALAADLLARLPESQLALRMTERAKPLLRVGRGVRARLEAALPDGLDEAAARDIVLVKPPRGTGERAWWLAQILAATPLSVWEHELERRPPDLVSLSVADKLASAVHAGWSHAAARQLNAAWAEALLPKSWDARLISALPREVAERHVQKALNDARAHAALDQLQRPWGLELSRELVRRGLLSREAALALDPRVLDDLPDDAPAAVVQLLAFRHDLHKELS
jgi:hypothetical protein